MIQKARRAAKDPLYRNSMYIMATSVVSSAFGFLFWIIAAKLYPKEDVGIATALISTMSFLTLLTRFGLDYSMIRFMPSGDKNRIYNTTQTITTLAIVLSGVLFIALADKIAPQLSLLRDPMNAMLFLSCSAAYSVLSMSVITFVALREARFQLLQSLIQGARILFLYPLIFLGAMGIYSSFGVGYLIALATLLIILIKKQIRPKPEIDITYLRSSLAYSAGSYVSNLFAGAPAQILPILILNQIGAEQAAYYYIAYSIAGTLYMIPTAVGTSLFVEGSHGEQLKKTVLKALKWITLILSPSIAVLYLFSGYLLTLIGKDYGTGATELLQIMTFVSIPLSANSIYMAIARIQKDMKELVMVSSICAFLLPSSAYVFMQQYGLLGIGYAWMLTYGIVTVVIVVLVKKKGWA